MTDKPRPFARTSRRFDVPPEEVFDAWLDPKKVAMWFGPGLGDMVRVDVEPKEGGSFSFVQRRDGEDIDHTGQYLEVKRPTRLVFTWSVQAYSPVSDRVILEIFPLTGGCEATVTHELHPEWAEFADRAAKSWAEMLDAMAAAVRSS
jgi:uncharacterized protein YndB with AHSA1/START domain